MLQPHPSSPPEQGLVRPALISIAGQWKSAAGRHRGCVCECVCVQTLRQRGFVSPWLGGIPPRDLLSASHPCPPLPCGVWGPPWLCPLSAVGGCTEEVMLCSRCCGFSAQAQRERGRWLFPLSSSRKQHPLCPLKHPLSPHPQISPTATPAASPLCSAYGVAAAAKGLGNQLINRNQGPRV